MKVQNQWEERFGWYWINAKEVFDYTDEDFERAVQPYVEAGVTTVINHGCAHFRFSYYPYWDKIIACMRKVVEHFHKYGIKVVEHHSSSLMHNLRIADGWRRLEGEYRSYANGECSVENWPKIITHLIEDPMMEGKHVLDWCQVSGKTGEREGSNYASHCFCFNNPDYFEAYCKHLDDLIDAGVDGIMNDDVQYFGNGHSCACEHCRKKFLEESGYTLPQPEDWDAFYGDYSSPMFLAWIQFKHKSTSDFYRRIYKHYEKRGHKNLYPNYTSGCVLHNRTAYPFDDVPEYWDFMFQENCLDCLQRYSIHYYMVEAVQRYAQGQRKDVPSMSMFYPMGKSDMYAAFAMSRSWGQLFTATPEGFSLVEIEKFYRDFEKKNEVLYRAPKKMKDLSFYMSKKTRDLTEDAEARYMIPMFGMVHAAYAKNLTSDMIFENDTAEILAEHKNIVMPYVAMADDAELRKLRSYAEDGGRLFIFGDFACFQENGSHRTLSEICEIFGIKATAKECDKVGPVKVSYCGKELSMTACKTRVAFSGEVDAVATLEDGTCIGMRQTVGKGEVIWMGFDSNHGEAQGSVWSPRRNSDPVRVPAAPYVIDILRNTTGTLLELFVGTPVLSIESGFEDVMVSAFAVEGGYAVHLLNTDGWLPKEPCLIGHEDEAPTFVDGAPKLPELQLKLNLPIKVNSVSIHSPEQENAKSVPFVEKDDGVVLTIPKDFFSGYAVLYVKER
ncbi:MAG: hypothetical protein E7471_02200 [Ruminococcaceae bacterium]|nr:hypothetical protein [Oscillospiraceae bacterium]